jgi:hypothetical protein
MGLSRLLQNFLGSDLIMTPVVLLVGDGECAVAFVELIAIYIGLAVRRRPVCYDY